MFFVAGRPSCNTLAWWNQEDILKNKTNERDIVTSGAGA